MEGIPSKTFGVISSTHSCGRVSYGHTIRLYAQPPGFNTGLDNRLPHLPATLGTIFGSIPVYHIVVENILCGRSDDPAIERWETYGPKLIDYFYPESGLLPS